MSRSKPLRRPPALSRDDGPMTLEQWLAGGRARLMVSRKDLVVFSEAYLRQRVVPLIADCLKTYEKERRRNRWWRRAWRWLGTRVLGDPAVEPASTFLDAMKEEMEDAAAEVAEEQAGEEEVPLPRSCAVCGSYQLEPVNEQGGLKCDRGHVIEEPPPPDYDAHPQAGVHDAQVGTEQMGDGQARATLREAAERHTGRINP